LKALVKKVDMLIVGGGIANTFLAATGYNVGKSLYEPDFIDEAKSLMTVTQIPIPTDVVCDEEGRILDIGPKTAESFSNYIQQAGTILWNGPLGVFEKPRFANGTRVVAQAIARAPGFSVAGGGDTLAAIEQFGVSEQVSYISTGGGAFLEFVEGKELPGIAALG
ncbi:MAG: phosphoglycerate kinase, partial [Gammaproteobacteria bacterium]